MDNDFPKPGNEKSIEMSFLRPPILRASTKLDRALFAKTVNLAAASVKDNKNIAKYRKALDKNADLLHASRLSPIVPDPDQNLAAKGKKCLLLRPSISAKSSETWSSAIQDAVKYGELEIIPYELRLGYNYWGYHDVLSSLLPKEMEDDMPSGFNTAGHVAHLNLRDHHLPYKKLIAQVLIDKNPHIRTVINKIDNVGFDSEFRTFNYEVLAGPDDMDVEVHEGDCVFRFDYSKVYWNSKLETEHRRLIGLFKPGEVVCDVMAGIGPFAVPAGKKGVFVWANDYNPASYDYLKEAIDRNKVRPSCRTLARHV